LFYSSSSNRGASLPAGAFAGKGGKSEAPQLRVARGDLWLCEARFSSVEKSPGLDSDALTTYLNDHLAGSVAALELIEHLAKHSGDSALASFFNQLHAEITADQDVLRELLRGLAANESALRKAGAWIVEKLGQAKLGLKEHDVSGIGLLEALEGLTLGIAGKQLLWRSLATAATALPQLQGLDYARLERRAIEQRDRVEERRLAAAREAFKPQPSN
jgi:hypothetical protein